MNAVLCRCVRSLYPHKADLEIYTIHLSGDCGGMYGPIFTLCMGGVVIYAYS